MKTTQRPWYLPERPPTWLPVLHVAALAGLYEVVCGLVKGILWIGEQL